MERTKNASSHRSATPEQDIWVDTTAGRPSTVDEPQGQPKGAGWERAGLAPWVEPFWRYLWPRLPLLGVYAIVRVGLLIADALSAHISFGTHPTGPLENWDGSWYLRVAAHGYPYPAATSNGHLTYSEAGFGPVFPALIRLVGFLGFTPAQAALTVSLIGGAVTVLLVDHLGTILYDERVARIGAVLFTLFPGMAVAWGLFYCECVGLAFVAGFLILMRSGRWVWAGVLGALATATSPMALCLVPAASVPVIADLRQRRFPKAIATVLIAPLGFVGYVGFLAIHYHDVLFWWHLQHQAWGARVDFGRSLFGVLRHPWLGGYQGKGWMEWVGVVAVLGAIYAIFKAKLPPTIVVYCASVFVLMFVSNSLGFKPRLLTWAFPALIAVAALLRERGWQYVALSFAYLMPLVFVVYSSLGNYIIQP